MAATFSLTVTELSPELGVSLTGREDGALQIQVRILPVDSRYTLDKFTKAIKAPSGSPWGLPAGLSLKTPSQLGACFGLSQRRVQRR